MELRTLTFFVSRKYSIYIEAEDAGFDMDANAIERIKESLAWFYICHPGHILYVGDDDGPISRDYQEKYWDETILANIEEYDLNCQGCERWKNNECRQDGPLFDCDNDIV